MTNIHSSGYTPMFVPKKFALPHLNAMDKDIMRELINANEESYLFFSKIILQLKRNDDIIKALSVDISFIRDKYSKNTVFKHISYLVKCNLIIKQGNKNSWTYLVNPNAFHCLNHNQRKNLWPAIAPQFPDVNIILGY